jgi:hypothetical protein
MLPVTDAAQHYKRSDKEHVERMRFIRTHLPKEGQTINLEEKENIFNTFNRLCSHKTEKG